MKRKIAIFVILMLLSAFQSVSAFDVKYDRDARKVLINGTSNNNEIISVLIADSSMEFSKDTENAEILDKTIMFDQIVADNEGNYTYEFSADKKGNYKIVLTGMSENGYKKEDNLEVFSSTELDNTLINLSNASSSGKTALQNFLNDSSNRLILGIDALYSESKKNNLLEGLYDAFLEVTYYPNYATVDLTIEQVEEQNLLMNDVNSMVNKAQVQDVIKRLYEIYAESDDSYLKYTSMSDKSSVNSEIFIGKPYTSLEDLQQKFIDTIKNIPSNNKTHSSGGSSGASGGSSFVVMGNSEVAKANSESNVSIFDDVPESHWANDSIEYLAQKGIVSGIGNGLFAPDKKLTREEFVKMLVNTVSLKVEQVSEINFSDVDVNKWYAPYIATAKNAGIVDGLSQSCFGVGVEISRQDMAVMICRAAKMLDVNIDSTSTIKFDDVNEISDYAKESVAALANANIVKGFDNNRFEPNATATRAQASQLICSLLKFTGDSL